MSNGILNRLKTWVSGDPFDEDIYQMEDEMEFRAYNPHHEPEPDMMDLQDNRKNRKQLKVVDHPNQQLKTQVVVIEPRAFEEALEIIEHLRSRRSVILNLHLLDTAQSQRVVDFLSGATHAIDGHQQRIGDGVFIFTPNNVSIRSDAEQQGAGMALQDAFWKPGVY